MMDNYAKIVRDNLEKLYAGQVSGLEKLLPAKREGDMFEFRAFGKICRVQPDGIFMDGKPLTGVLGILISLYALHARPDACILEPLKAYKDFPGSMPYVGAFASHTEQVLTPMVENIRRDADRVMAVMTGEAASTNVGGDFSFVVYPLPKVALCYIFYMPDEDFPASATCLFSNNANAFMPLDGLADVGEYTSKRILEISG